MRSLFKYHILTLTPIFVLCFLYAYKIIDGVLFFILFCVYGLLIRPIIDYKKLKAKGLVTKKTFLKSLGFIRFRYYTELMFED